MLHLNEKKPDDKEKKIREGRRVGHVNLFQTLPPPFFQIAQAKKARLKKREIEMSEMCKKFLREKATPDSFVAWQVKSLSP